jgi:hypothetical protein
MKSEIRSPKFEIRNKFKFQNHNDRATRTAALLGLAMLLPLVLVSDGATAEREHFRAADGRYLKGFDHYSQLRESIAAARARILVVMYLMVSGEVEGHPVLTLIRDLEAAKARGVDVLVIIDDHRAARNALAIRQLKDRGIDVRHAGGDRITHAKLVVADDEVFVGSANWSTLALTGGNIESTVRVRDHALADRLYAARLDFLTSQELESLRRIERVFLAEASDAFRSIAAGGLRRDLAASGIDLDALANAGAGWVPAPDTDFKAAVLAGAGVRDGWARWNLPQTIAGLLVLPSKADGFALIDPRSWRLVQGRIDQETGVFKTIRERLNP